MGHYDSCYEADERLRRSVNQEEDPDHLMYAPKSRQQLTTAPEPHPSTKTEWVMRKAIEFFKYKNARYRAGETEEFAAFKQSSLVRAGALSPIGQAVAWASKQWDTAVRLLNMHPDSPIPQALLKEKLTDTMIYCAIALAMLEESPTENLKKVKQDEQL